MYDLSGRKKHFALFLIYRYLIGMVIPMVTFESIFPTTRTVLPKKLGRYLPNFNIPWNKEFRNSKY